MFDSLKTRFSTLKLPRVTLSKAALGQMSMLTKISAFTALMIAAPIIIAILAILFAYLVLDHEVGKD